MQGPAQGCRSGSTRRRFATAGVAGATLALSAAAGVPALADSPGSHSSHSSHGSGASSHRSSADPAHSPSSARSEHSASQDASGHGAPATGSDSTGHNPPGNNGTVFIHDVADDQSPHNVPHVSCNFYADFFGFDSGQTVTVSFAGQAPTGPGTALGGTWTGVISTDDASGAGQDFDDELAFTADQLGVSALGAPAAQGYHVKMTVATGEPGGKKSKVFWIEPCAAVIGGTTGAAVLGDTFGRAVLGAPSGNGSVSATGAAQPAGTTVLGEHFTRSVSGDRVAGNATGLPFTGSEVKLMAAAAIAAIGAGLLFITAGRRRRTTMPG